MSKGNKEMFEHMVTTYIQTKTQTNVHQLKLADIVAEAKSKLTKREWRTWLKDSRINLKGTQAKKLITISQFCRQGGQSTDLFYKEGVEKTYLIARVQSEETQNQFLQLALSEVVSTAHLKKAIKLSVKNGISANDALQQSRLIKPKSNKPTKLIELREAIEHLRSENEKLKEELSAYRQENVINIAESPSTKEAEIDKDQTSLFTLMEEEANAG